MQSKLAEGKQLQSAEEGQALMKSGAPSNDSPKPILRFGPTSKHKMILRRSETWLERMQRLLQKHLGVIVFCAAPLVLILMIFSVLPSKSPATSSSSALNTAAESDSGPFVYNIVLDAGSTGSRIHIYKFKQQGKQLQLISDGFHQLKPGLSAFPDNPEQAAQSLKPLMAEAIKEVPKAQQASTGLSLKATAGLRLLPGSKADNILKAVTAFLKTYPFSIKADAIGIMDGAHEGAYAWLTLNYLLGKLQQGPEGTVAAIDLGGGSVQEAFALPPDEARSAPAGYVTQLAAGDATYNIYVHSYLGYGLMAARAKVIEVGGADPSHPCFSKGSSVKYTYAGKEYAIAEVVEGGDFKRCAAMAFKALEHDKDCGQPKEACSFSGAWRGKPRGMQRVYYVSSYFWDRALESGIIDDKAAIEWKTSPADFARRATAACGKGVAELAKIFGSLDVAQAPYFCLDLSFCHTVLTQGFDLPESAGLTLVKQVKYNGQIIEAAWPLGAAIDDLSSSS